MSDARTGARLRFARFGGHALAVTGMFGAMHLLGQARAWDNAAAGALP